MASLKSDISEIEHYRDTYQELESKYNNLNSQYTALQSENKNLQEQIDKNEATRANANDSASTDDSALDNTNTDSSSSDDTNSYSVYITKTGDKYHTSSCSYLRKSKIELSKQDAISRGYTACGRCNP